MTPARCSLSLSKLVAELRKCRIFSLRYGCLAFITFLTEVTLYIPQQFSLWLLQHLHTHVAKLGVLYHQLPGLESELLETEDIPRSALYAHIADGTLFDEHQGIFTPWASSQGKVQGVYDKYKEWAQKKLTPVILKEQSSLDMKSSSIRGLRIVLSKLPLEADQYRSQPWLLLHNSYFFLGKAYRALTNWKRDSPQVFGHMMYTWYYYRSFTSGVVETEVFTAMCKDLCPLLHFYSATREEVIVNSNDEPFIKTVSKWTWWDVPVRSLVPTVLNFDENLSRAKIDFDEVSHNSRLGMQKELRHIAQVVCNSSIAKYSFDDAALESRVWVQLRHLLYVSHKCTV